MDLSDLARKVQSQKELHLKVKVVPKSSRNKIVGFMADGTLKVKVQAAPEKGKANAELCSFLARELKVSRRSVIIVSGQTAPLKHIRVSVTSHEKRR